ncbi:MAG: hydrogenase maturation factor [Lachnospiraceae bacterium]|nr:hydrogenase maturation factor [Lachnospiraceae bacterium]
MKSGKISEAVLKRSIIKTVNKQGKQSVISRAGVGVDAGLFMCEEMTGVMASSCTTLAGAEEGLGAMAVHRACNSLAAAGGLPVAVTVQLMLPESAEEAELKDSMKEILSACEKAGVALAQGHTQVSTFVTERVISVTAMGSAPAVMTLEEDVYGSDLVMTKSAGLAGAALLAKHYRENLHERYTYAFLEKAAARQPEVSVLPEIKAVKELGVRHMHDVAEGGVFGAVWELCERLHAGVELELKKIPIQQETVEISEYFDINPYQLKGDGALLFLTHDSNAAISKLKAQGIPAVVIGRITDNHDRIVINEEETRFLEPNRVDEYEKARTWEKKVR